ncbi:MAG: EscU/YscU/HrcU family type III secretion system export apparatus switch protein [Sphingomonadaceae bacterium]|nr:EscU/YscU/HrcU family type III secretion system export apparatus switch protein [Sphingomonadaceae bacterium]
MSDASEKPFDPTPKRLREAAKKGDVLRSKELATAAVMLVGASWLVLAGPWLLADLAELARAGFRFDRGELESFQPGVVMTSALKTLLPPIFLLAIPVLIAALVAQLGIGDGRWVGGNIAFKGSRINPLSGLKRMFGMNGLIEMGKGLAKVALLGGIAWLWGLGWVETIAGLGRGSLSSQLTAGWGALTSLLFALSGGLVVIALVDVPIQWSRRQKRLKMSHQELKDEAKEAEGSPEAKQARKQRQREIARGAVTGAMRQAQFLVTNPTHFAIAMTYDPARASAPIVLAKGRGDKALAMRELAGEFGVPMLEYPQLARAIFFTTRESQTIREELYAAVAAVVAFVLSLKRGEHVPLPEIAVPLELRFDADGQREA